MPFFSIIIPTYNSADKIGIAVESLLSQTFTDFEIHIVDGLSTDDTMQILRLYAQKDQRVTFASEEDNGIYDAMNKGIDRANGQYLYFMGSDDALFSPDVLQRIWEQASKTNAAVLYGSVKIDGDTGWAKDGDIYAGPFNLHKLIWQNICHQAIFYNRKVFKKTGYFNTAYRICADWDFNLHCFARFRFQYVDIVVALYFGGGVSGVKEDTAFMENKLSNIIRYFQNKLFYNDFVQLRAAFRNKIFSKDPALNPVVRAKLLVSSVILQLKPRAVQHTTEFQNP